MHLYFFFQLLVSRQRPLRLQQPTTRLNRHTPSRPFPPEPTPRNSSSNSTHSPHSSRRNTSSTRHPTPDTHPHNPLTHLLGVVTRVLTHPLHPETPHLIQSMTNPLTILHFSDLGKVTTKMFHDKSQYFSVAKCNY